MITKCGCVWWINYLWLQGGKPDEANDVKSTNEIQTSLSDEVKHVVHGDQVADEQQQVVAASS